MNIFRLNLILAMDGVPFVRRSPQPPLKVVAVIGTVQVGSNPEIELFYALFVWIASAYASQ
jgi:hypothetical protein